MKILGTFATLLICASLSATEFQISAGFNIQPGFVVQQTSPYEVARREAWKAGKGLVVWIGLDPDRSIEPNAVHVRVDDKVWHGVEGPAVVIAEPCSGEAGLRWRETRLFRAGRFRTSYRSSGYSSAPPAAEARSPASSRTSGYRVAPVRLAAGGC